MITTNYSNFRQNLASIMDRIETEEAVALITRAKGKPMVMMTLEEFESWKETEYLMSSPANYAELKKGIEDVKNGNLIEVDFDDFMKILDDPMRELNRLNQISNHETKVTVSQKMS